MGPKYGFDPDVTGKVAECDGGTPTQGGPAGWLGSRDFFRGRLTGRYYDYDENTPSWRWFELTDLTIKPEEHMDDTVWCEQSFLFLMDN